MAGVLDITGDEQITTDEGNDISLVDESETGVSTLFKEKNNDYAIQGGGPNYLGKQPEVKVPRYWKSSPEHPDTELAYITGPEKQVLIDLNLHGGLEDGKPNTGPNGVISLQGDMGSIGGGGNTAGGNNDRPTMADVAGPTTTTSTNTDNKGSDQDHSRFDVGSGYYGEPVTETTTKDDNREKAILTRTYPKRYKTVETPNPHLDKGFHTTEIRDYYDPQGHQKRAPKNEQEKSTLDKIGLWTSILAFGLPIVGIKVPGVIKAVNTTLGYRNKINTALEYGQKIGLFDDTYTVDELFEKELEKAKDKKAKMDEYNSLPPGHPDKIALEAELKIGMEKDENTGGDGPEAPVVAPVTEEIEDAYAMVGNWMQGYRDLKSKQALSAQLQEKWADEREWQQETMFANSGGLANLFRVKNY